MYMNNIKLAGPSGQSISAYSMFWHGQYLRSLRECRSPARLIFKHGQVFIIQKTHFDPILSEWNSILPYSWKAQFFITFKMFDTKIYGRVLDF